MGVVADVCRKITALLPEQVDRLEQICSLLQLACDLSHAQATVYAKAQHGHFLAIVAQARPNTTCVKGRSNLLGSTVQAAEEPLVWRTMETGDSIAGQREWALGLVADMRTFAVVDRKGAIMAVVSFETGGVETIRGQDVLMETADMLLKMAGNAPTKGNTVYRRLSARDGIIIVDDQGEIIFANAAANSIYNILGIGRVLGRRIHDRRINLRVAQKASVSRQPIEEEVEQGQMMLVHRAIPVLSDGKTALRTIVITSDVTELKQKEKELLIKSAVIQEIHHRVKNNLQTIASLLRLQARRTKSPEVKAALRESVNRILSISVVHEFLSQQDQEVIDVAEVAKNILDLVIQSMLEPDFNIQTVFNGQTVILPSEQATSLALVINELIQNSIEHGFTNRREGLIGIDIVILDTAYQIEIYDNGVGLPADFGNRSPASLGLQIVRTLIETDMGGRFELFSQNGTHACITIPKTSREV